MTSGTRVVIALVVAMIAGIAIGASGNAALLGATDWLVPVGALWVGAIRMTVIPLVVALVITGVASAADVRSVGRIGARTVGVFLALLLGAAAIAVPLAPLAFSGLAPAGAARTLPPGAAEAARAVAESGGAASGTAWLLSLVPANPIAAAASGAMLPLVIFTILFAVALAQLPPASRAPVLGVARSIGDAMQVIVRGVIALAPIGVFALVVPLAARTGSAFAGAIGLYVVVYSLGCVVNSLLLYPVVAFTTGRTMREFARAAWPPQLFAFTSSSSVASLPALVQAADGPLALPPQASGFVLPVAVSTFKFASPLAWSIGACFIGWFYGVPLHARELATVAFAGVFLSFAAPGVPNGAFLLLTPLFVQIGLPAEGIGVLIALDAIPDRFSTALNVTGDLAAAAIVAGRERAQGTGASSFDIR